MKQTDDEPDNRTLTAQAQVLRLHLLVPHNEARERERYVQCVLAIVIDGVDAEIAGNFAREKLLEVLEGALSVFLPPGKDAP